MKAIILFAALLALVAAPAVTAQSTLSRVYNDLEIDIWTDKDDGSNYTEGDAITLYFWASRDCYVTIYDLDTRGNINLIFPAEPDMNNFVIGGEVYMIPEHGEDYELSVTGPPGYEYIQMVASVEPYPAPDWRGPISVHDKHWAFEFNDSEGFIDLVNRHYFPNDNVAFDQVSFYVAPAYYYKRVETDCYGDCGTVYIDYPYGCDVYIDGVYWGLAPLWIPSIYLGQHRVSVYWGTTIVFSDWIMVDYYRPYFIYTHPHYVFDYYYHHWYYDYDYRYRHYYGPSQFKYKPRRHYVHGRLDAHPGFKVVSNAHGKYAKSKMYSVAKTTRIGKYKKTYRYNTKTKTYSVTKRKLTKTYGTKSGIKAKTPSGSSARKGYDSRSAVKESVKSKATKKSSTYKSDKKGRQPSSSKSGTVKGSPKPSTKSKSVDKNKSTRKSKSYEPTKKKRQDSSAKSGSVKSTSKPSRKSSSTINSKPSGKSKSAKSSEYRKRTVRKLSGSSHSAGVKKSSGSSKKSKSSESVKKSSNTSGSSSKSSSYQKSKSSSSSRSGSVSSSKPSSGGKRPATSGRKKR